jgi:nucleoid-associated protein YgaU
MPPRTDGMFKWKEPQGGASWLRFFPDGTVTSVGTMDLDPLHKVLGWLLPPKKQPPTLVTIEGDAIEWVENDVVEYRGRWADDHLLLDTYSRINQWRGTALRYEFISEAAIEEARVATEAKREARKAAKAAKAAKPAKAKPAKKPRARTRSS